MNFSYDMYCPFDDMDEAEYNFYQNQQMIEDWQWYEYQKSLQIDRPSPFDEIGEEEIDYDCNESDYFSLQDEDSEELQELYLIDLSHLSDILDFVD
jgi:hypothetical protein